MFPADGIKIISGTLHSHHAGRKMTLRHVRDGKELERIIEDDNYDYNYQQVRQLERERVVLPGDYIITDCAYEVSRLTDIVQFKCINSNFAHSMYSYVCNLLLIYTAANLLHTDIEPQASDLRWLFNQTGDVSVFYHLLSAH